MYFRGLFDTFCPAKKAPDKNISLTFTSFFNYFFVFLCYYEERAYSHVIARNEETKQSRYEWFILLWNIPFGTGTAIQFRLSKMEIASLRKDCKTDTLIKETLSQRL